MRYLLPLTLAACQGYQLQPTLSAHHDPVTDNQVYGVAVTYGAPLRLSETDREIFRARNLRVHTVGEAASPKPAQDPDVDVYGPAIVAVGGWPWWTWAGLGGVLVALTPLARAWLRQRKASPKD